MKLLLTLIVLGVIGYLIYNMNVRQVEIERLSKELAGKHEEIQKKQEALSNALSTATSNAKTGELKQQLAGRLTDTLSALLSPLAPPETGSLEFKPANQDLYGIRTALLGMFPESDPKNSVLRSNVSRLSDAMTRILEERYAVIRRINEAESSTQRSELRGPTSSSSTTYGYYDSAGVYHYRSGSTTTVVDPQVERDELKKRVKWWQMNAAKQWETMSRQYRKQLDPLCTQIIEKLNE